MNPVDNKYVYKIESFNSLMSAAQWVDAAMKTKPIQQLLDLIRRNRTILREVGLSENEIYDITGDADMVTPTYNDITRMTRTTGYWSYVVGGVTPDYMRNVPLVWFKITKVEDTPRPKVDILMSSFQTMRV